ncbi:MAG: sulfotransferase [Roseibium sp.]
MPNAPIIIASPTLRSGATLFQRLLSSSDNGICYGEDAARRLLTLSEFAHNESILLQQQEDRQTHYWNKILEGNLDFGLVDLELPGDFARHALVGALTFFRQHYDEATKVIEKEIWACKISKCSFLNVVKAADFVSDLKCIYVYRNIVDTAMSQKSLGLINDEQELAALCTEWVVNTDVIAALSRKNFEQVPEMLLPIKFEDFLANGPKSVRQLESFTGMRGIKGDILKEKFNRWPQASDFDPTPILSYEKPVPLSETELNIVAHICGDRMREIYPEKHDELSATSAAMH